MKLIHFNALAKGGLLAEKIIIDPSSEDYDARMKHAKAVAEWELGDSHWAGRIIGAFLWPDPAALELEKNDPA